jgi:AraC-like DNA-binding protein
MKNPIRMTESPIHRAKQDRLTAFLKAFELTAALVECPSESVQANLFVTASVTTGNAERVVYFARGGRLSDASAGRVVAAIVEFGGGVNPLLDALPEQLAFDLAAETAMRGIADLFMAEARDPRCGAQFALDRLAEVIVLKALRKAIALGTAGAGLIAAMAHPQLHRPIVAMHDSPQRPWTSEELAVIAGMSRSHFMQQFRIVVGTTPLAYLNSWRLVLGRRELGRGHAVKRVARSVGFGSADAFSRAFSRKYGHPPTSAVSLLSTFADAPRGHEWHHRIASLRST